MLNYIKHIRSPWLTRINLKNDPEYQALKWLVKQAPYFADPMYLAMSKGWTFGQTQNSLAFLVSSGMAQVDSNGHYQVTVAGMNKFMQFNKLLGL